ncbi:hypothetical protein DNK59_03200 [Pseudomonas sp. TKO26]|nr:hypothetical protein DNK62_03200 [Pseudomonas sp. TKO30]PYY94938.1 hypothetical protein DNK61_03200 [Pseudomonas sp. TKO29]PYY96811.1 hypothetical protein DNK59_03200 [Pseudomonas sp. TKO26]PYZ02403.1 hypothetical protein DNK60_03200 [Pseudomonas sp. TKO14]
MRLFTFNQQPTPPDYKQSLKPHLARLSDSIISNPAPNKTYAGLSKKLQKPAWRISALLLPDDSLENAALIICDSMLGLSLLALLAGRKIKFDPALG